jgi:hypothetical protein
MKIRPDGKVAVSRKKEEPRLYGAAEAARVLGVSQTNLRRIPTLPQPYAILAMGTVWRAEDVDSLAKQRAKSRRVPAAA